MKHRLRLFLTKDIYNLPATDNLFAKAMLSNLRFHRQHCPEYRDILSSFGFDEAAVRTADDLYKIPPLPTSYLKNQTLLSKPFHTLFIKTTSSGTGGKKTLSGFDLSSAICGLFMLLRVLRFHRLISLRRTNYIILGYQPHKSNQTAMAKSLRGSVCFAPPAQIAYALKFENGEYHPDVEGLVAAAVKFGRQNRPVRLIGFPAYLKLFLDELSARDIALTFNKHSKIILGGGWKSFFADEIPKEQLFGQAADILGVDAAQIKDQFGTAEHPINYTACKNGHFHVPVFSRVVIRDVHTMEPVPYGTPGLLNLISPLLSSAPYGSILTDDLAVMQDGSACGCGISSPFFTPLGRAGLASVKTCTQAASAYLEGI